MEHKTNNKNNNKLVLLTNRFPYHPGEQFLENEIKYLSDKFDEVHIIPINLISKTEKRDTPSNVIIHDYERVNGSTKKLTDFTKKVFLTKQGLSWFMQDLKRSLAIHPKCPLILMNWLGNAINIKDYILNEFGSKIEEYTFYSYWLTTSALALSMLKEEMPQAYTVSRAHRGDLYEYTHIPKYLPLQKQILKNLDQVYIISNDGVNYLERKYGQEIDLSKLSVERLGTLKVDSKSVVSQEGVLRLVTCSFLSPVKRIDLLIHALKEIKDIEIEWRHIGDGKLRNKLEQQVQDLPNNISVRFLGSMDNVEVVKNYINEPVDLFVNVSESEGVPVSIMEAFSCAIPVLATDVGGTSELVNDQNGFLVNKDVTPLELANKIKEFYRITREQKVVKGREAWNTWNNLYNADKNYTKFAQKLKRG